MTVCIPLVRHPPKDDSSVVSCSDVVIELLLHYKHYADCMS